MTVFLVSPFIGMGISRFGVKRTLNVGIGTVGVVLVAYGCLGLLKSGPMFLGLSMGLRYVLHTVTLYHNRSTKSGHGTEGNIVINQTGKVWENSVL